MGKIISFALNSVDKLKEDDRFLYLDLKLAVIGKNENGSYISKEVYEDAKSTLEYLPLCVVMNNTNSDFLEHKGKHQCIGAILSLEDNNYRYEIIDGNEYVVVNAVVFKDYCQEEAMIIMANGFKETSIEIEVLKKHRENGLIYFDKIRYLSCLFLGTGIKPGMKGCKAEVVNYSEDIEAIKVAFSKATMSDTNGLLDKLVDDDSNIEIKGESQDLDNHNNTVDSLENFSEGGKVMNKEAMMKMYSAFKGHSFSKFGMDMPKYSLFKMDENFAYALNNETAKMAKIPYSLENEEYKCEFEEAEEKEVEDVEAMAMQNAIETMCGMIGKMAEEKETMSQEFSAKTDTIVSMGAELDSIKAEIASIKEEVTNKDNTIAEYALKEKQSAAESIISKYSLKLNEEEQKELKSKVETFSKIEDFEKEVKAFVCDKYENEIKNRQLNPNVNFMNANININNNIKDSDPTSWTTYINEYLNKN